MPKVYLFLILLLVLFLTSCNGSEVKSIIADKMSEVRQSEESKAVKQLLDSDYDPQKDAEKFEVNTYTLFKMEKLYRESKYSEAIDIARKIIYIDPNNKEAYYYIGQILTDLGLPNDALPYLHKVTELDTANSNYKSKALYNLAKCSYMLSNHNSAQKFLGELKMKPEADNLLGTFGYKEAFADWTTVESTNYIFHFEPETKVKAIDKYIKARENAVIKVNEFFNAKLPKKIDFFVWSSRENAKEILGRELGFANPPVTLIHSFYNQTLGHEITHVISHYTGVEKATGLINEGIAVYLDLSKQDKLSLARKAIKEQGLSDISIKRYWLMWDSKNAAVTYPLAGAFIKHLIDKEGKEKMLKLIKNQTLENAKVIYGEERLNILIAEFEGKLK